MTKGLLCFAVVIIAVVCGCFTNAYGQAGNPNSASRPTEEYLNMPSIAPIGVKIGKYMDVPPSAVGPAIDAAKGYRVPPKWSNRLAAFDVYIWDQCYAMEQSLRIE